MSETGNTGSPGRPSEPRSFGGGRYVVQQRLGAGNFATVYLAFDERLDVPVAVKLLADHWSWDAEIRGRFVQEARLLRSLNDPRVVQIRDIAETEDGRPYLVMDLASEGTLEQRLVELAHRGDRPPVSELREFVGEVAAALDVLHARRIAHRDLKPSNLLITRDDALSTPGRRPDGLLRPGERLVLGDLGLAKDLRADSGVTVGVGTAGYMAPEQSLPGSRIDTRTDIYAVSALVSQVATGEVPDPVRRYSDGSVTSGRPLPPSITGPFRDALARGLDQDPAKRPPTIGEWAAAVDAGLAVLDTRRPGDAPDAEQDDSPHDSPHDSPPAVPAPAEPSSAEVTVETAPGLLDGRAGRRRVLTIAGAGLAVLVVLVVGLVALGGGDSPEAGADATTTSAPAATSTSTSAPAATTTPSTVAPTSAPATTVAATTPSTVAAPAPTSPPSTIAPPASPSVRIIGPTEIPANVDDRWWEVEAIGVVGGTWRLSGPNGEIALNGDQWVPGDGFQAGLRLPGAYVLTLVAVDAVGNVYPTQLAFTVV